MRAIDSFLNTEEGLLIIGVDDNKRPLGLDGDYSAIKGDRNNFDKVQNHLRKLIQNTYFKNSIVQQLIEIKRSQIDGKDVCLIDIHNSTVPIFHGSYFIKIMVSNFISE
jgi:predicted HTH transcriptional regulator